MSTTKIKFAIKIYEEDKLRRFIEIPFFYEVKEDSVVDCYKLESRAEIFREISKHAHFAALLDGHWGKLSYLFYKLSREWKDEEGKDVSLNPFFSVRKTDEYTAIEVNCY